MASEPPPAGADREPADRPPEPAERDPAPADPTPAHPAPAERDTAPAVGGAADPDPAAEVHRLHPVSLLFRVGSAGRQILLPLILVLFASGRADNLYWIAAAVLVGVVHGVFHYVTYRYRFEGDELVVRGGVLFRFERHIPYERIQNIDLRQSVVHRLFGVADVRVETGSGSEAEARLQVLALDAVERMREQVFGAARRSRAARAAAAAAGDRDRAHDVGAPAAAPHGAAPDHGPAAPDAPEPEPTPLLRLAPADILLFGLLSNRGLVIVGFLLGLVFELDLLDEDTLGENMNIDPSELEAQLTWTTGIALVLGALLATRLLSVLWALVNLHGFELLRRGSDLQTRTGLFTRHTATIPRRRIQVVTVSAGPLHRLVRRASVKVDTAGGNALENEAATRRWVAPLVRVAELPALLEELLPGLQPEAFAWQQRHPAAWRRLLKRWVVVALLAGLSAGLLADAWVGAGAAALLVLWGALDAPVRARAAQWARAEGFFSVRHGVYGRRWRLVAERKLQVVRLASSPFDRRWEMAALLADTAGTTFSVELGLLPRADVEVLADALTRRMERTHFAW